MVLGYQQGSFCRDRSGSQSQFSNTQGALGNYTLEVSAKPALLQSLFMFSRPL